MRAAEDRFFDKVVEVGDCWQWISSIGRNGYGRFWFEKASVLAHRWAWEFFNGPIPDGLVIDHECHNRWCVNPWHMTPTIPRENSRNLAGPYATTTSGVLGVAWCSTRQMWRACRGHGVERTSKYFEDLGAAARWVA